MILCWGAAGLQKTALDPLLEWLARAGFLQPLLKLKGELLIVKLPPSDGRRLLADAKIRQQFVAQAKLSGFSRVALELGVGS